MELNNLDDLDRFGNEEINRMVDKDCGLAIGLFKKMHPSYEIVFQTPYGVFGQHKENSTNFVVLGVQPSCDVYISLLSEGRIYTA